MLVLARQVNERIIMPTVEATIEVVAVKANGVRLGIEAPPQVTILREEVLRRDGAAPAALVRGADRDAESTLNRVRHLLRNRLQSVALGLSLLRQQMESSPVPGLTGLLQHMEDEVRTLDRQLRSLLSGETDVLAPTASREALEGGLAI